MSQLMPQIKSHRAMADALADVSRKTETLSVAHLLMSMAEAHGAAADALEAGQRAHRGAHGTAETAAIKIEGESWRPIFQFLRPR
jgi:ABC-type transport system involved in Fe-S cluster assembly fused permease/ATPase subunit